MCNSDLSIIRLLHLINENKSEIQRASEITHCLNSPSDFMRIGSITGKTEIQIEL